MTHIVALLNPGEPDRALPTATFNWRMVLALLVNLALWGMIGLVALRLVRH